MTRRTRQRVLLGGAVIFILLLLLCRPWDWLGGPPPAMAEVRDVEQLRVLFNQEIGAPRLILLLSPT